MFQALEKWLSLVMALLHNLRSQAHPGMPQLQVLVGTVYLQVSPLETLPWAGVSYGVPLFCRDESSGKVGKGFGMR